MTYDTRATHIRLYADWSASRLTVQVTYPIPIFNKSTNVFDPNIFEIDTQKVTICALLDNMPLLTFSSLSLSSLMSKFSVCF